MRNNGAYLPIILSPFSFEDPFTFAMSIPGLFYVSFLTETRLGSRAFGALLLANCLIAALATVIWHRYIGYL